MEKRSIILNIVLDKLRRNPLLSDIPFETVVDYAVEFMQIEGFPGMLDKKESIIEIKDNRGLLPDDCVEVLAVRLNSFKKPRFRHQTETFDQHGESTSRDFTYRINGSAIYTSLESGEIEIAYSAFETDPNGFPLIPDDQKFIRALEAYIKVQHYTILFDLGKLQPAVLEKAEQDYCWAVGACEAEFHRVSMDKAESFGNQWRQILINDKAHRFDYADLGKRKEFRIV